ncbi:MAG: amidohydrolase family protein [Acidobacteria bacterium]|nr:amidohydrolase family protein [Acidobacteriota bacterium]
MEKTSSIFSISSLLFMHFCLALLAAPLQQPTIPIELLAYPDLIVYNGKIVTMDDRSAKPVVGTVVKAMAVRRGEIVKTGEDAAVLALAGPNTRRIDLKGKTVIPGLIDTHSHVHDMADHWGMPGIAPEINVPGETPEELAKNLDTTLKTAVSKASPGEWIRLNLPADSGYTLVNQQKKFKRGNLDSLAPENPVLVAIRTTSLVNGKAIQAVEQHYKSTMVDEALDRETGIATFGTEFIRAVPIMLLESRPDVVIENVHRELEEWAALGITTFSSHINVPGHVNAYAALDRAGLMPIRFAWTHRSGTIFNSDASSFYMRMGDLSGSGSDYWWNIGSTMGHLDQSYPGIASTLPAKPEIKAREINLGQPGDFKREVMLSMVRAGHRITGTHIAGDLAVDNFMDIIEEGSKAVGMSDEQIRAKGHVMDHCAMGPRPDQYERLKRMGITMSCGPKYIRGVAPRALRDYGEKSLERVVPMKSLIDSGVKTVWEIDEHAPDFGAFFYLALAVNRKGDDGRVWASDQRLDRVVALKTATSWASEYVMRPKVLGTLEPGKWADFAILNQDYFTVPEDQIARVRPLMAVVGGKTVFLDTALAKELGTESVGIQPRFLKPAAED